MRDPLKKVLFGVLAGVCLDVPLAGAGYLIFHSVQTTQARIEKVQRVSDCWNGLLDLVTLHPSTPRSEVTNEARVSAEISRS